MRQSRFILNYHLMYHFLSVLCCHASVAACKSPSTSSPEPRRLLGEVVRLELYRVGFFLNKIADLENGSVIELNNFFFKPTAVTVRAVLADEKDVDAVQFEVNGRMDYAADDSAPYFLCGDSLGFITQRCAGFDFGQYTITATPVSGGKAGVSKTITISIVEQLRKTPCGTPKFVGAWEDLAPYPVEAVVAQGTMFGDDFVIISGFDFTNFPSLPTAHVEVYALDVSDPKATWRRMDDCPVSEGITHTATAKVGSRFYLCGGSIGGNPGPDTDVCYVYDHSIDPGTSGQWSLLTRLPANRTAGGMVYDSKRNALYYGGGATHPFSLIAIIFSVDHRDHWMLDLGNVEAGWIPKNKIPCEGNHLGHTNAYDDKGNERHFFVGGQLGEDRWLGQRDSLFEWNAANETWTKRASLPFARSHTQSATNPVGCGFIITAGIAAWNSYLDDVHYYDIPTDTWTKIGSIPFQVNVPVCAVRDDYLYCATAGLSNRRKFILESNT